MPCSGLCWQRHWRADIVGGTHTTCGPPVWTVGGWFRPSLRLVLGCVTEGQSHGRWSQPTSPFASSAERQCGSFVLRTDQGEIVEPMNAPNASTGRPSPLGANRPARRPGRCGGRPAVNRTHGRLCGSGRDRDVTSGERPHACSARSASPATQKDRMGSRRR